MEGSGVDAGVRVRIDLLVPELRPRLHANQNQAELVFISLALRIDDKRKWEISNCMKLSVDQ